MTCGWPIAESPTCPMIRTIAWRPPPCARAYRKPERAYGSFVRSDFLRVHVPMTGIGAGPFSLALLRAIKVARSEAAAQMPGYISGKRR
jgi:hypothetical protein